MRGHTEFVNISRVTLLNLGSSRVDILAVKASSLRFTLPVRLRGFLAISSAQGIRDFHASCVCVCLHRDGSHEQVGAE